MIKRAVSAGIFFFIIAIGFLQKEELMDLMKEGGTLSILISILLVAICVFFPVIPFPVLAGVIGGIFGTTQGVLISLTGAMAGTMCFFFLSRYGFRDYAQKKLANHQKVREYEAFLNRNAFIAILISRLIPIIPAPAVNIICGLSHVSWLTFFIASSVGKLPNILILSYAGASFQNNKLFSIGIYILYLLIIVLVYYVFVYRRSIKKSID